MSEKELKLEDLVSKENRKHVQRFESNGYIVKGPGDYFCLEITNAKNQKAFITFKDLFLSRIRLILEAHTGRSWSTIFCMNNNSVHSLAVGVREEIREVPWNRVRGVMMRELKKAGLPGSFLNSPTLAITFHEGSLTRMTHMFVTGV